MRAVRIRVRQGKYFDREAQTVQRNGGLKLRHFLGIQHGSVPDHRIRLNTGQWQLHDHQPLFAGGAHGFGVFLITGLRTLNHGIRTVSGDLCNRGGKPATARGGFAAKLLLDAA